MDKRITFLNIFSGLDKEVLSRCSSYEINCYMGISLAVLIPIITGAAAAILAADYFTHSVLAKIFIALLWVCVVWMVERIITHSLRPGTLGVVGTIRVAIALLIGLVVSTMVSLVLFRDRIEMELCDQEQHERMAIEESYKVRSNEINAEVDRLQQRYESLQDALDLETQGLSGSGHYGHGPAAKRLTESMETARLDRDSKKSDANMAIHQLEIEKAEKLEKLSNKYRHAGLSTSLSTLNKLSNPFKNGMNIFLTRLVVACTLILLETIPLFSVCGKQRPEYFEIADRIQQTNIQVVSASDEHDQNVKLLEKNYALDIAERELHLNDLTHRIQNLERTYSCLAEGVHSISTSYREHTRSAATEAEWNKLDDLYDSALSSINCDK